MFFSAKITNSVLAYLVKNGADLEGLFDLTDVPTEFLRDPTCWLDATKVEGFLRTIEAEYCRLFPGENLIEAVGHNSHDLRSWGVLDSVLRMMVKPQDIFTQPQRFISYFVSPAPPLANIERSADQIAFDLPISHDEFPHVTTYLRSALEALPTFMGEEMAVARWRHTRLVVSWSKKQDSFFSADEEGRNINPEFMQSLISSLEEAQKELEKKQQVILEQNRKIKKIKEEKRALSTTETDQRFKSKLSQVQESWEQMDVALRDLQGQFMRLIDYQTRAQQLVTLLVGQDRMNKQVQEAMRRVDWEFVKNEFSHVVEEGVNNIRNIKQLYASWEKTLCPESEEKKVSAQLDEVVNRALSRVQSKLPKDVRVDRLMFTDQTVNLYPREMEEALTQLLSFSAESIEPDGTIRLVSRPKGGRVQIEISDTSPGMKLKDLKQSSYWKSAKSVIKKHKGKLHLTTREGEGSTFVIDLPM